MTHNLKTPHLLVDEIIRGLKNEFQMLEKYEKQVSNTKWFKILSTIMILLLVCGTAVCYINFNKAIDKKNEQIDSLSRQYELLYNSIQSGDESRIAFVSFGDSLIRQNRLSNLSISDRNIFLNTLWDTCKEFNMNPYLMIFVAEKESNFITTARSNHGARGIFQIMPSTYKMCAMCLHDDYDTNMYDVTKQCKYATFYLKYLYEDCDDIELALSRYNMGHTFYKNDYSIEINKRFKRYERRVL